ncbi:MAG: hypothetical protein ACO2PM_23685 [Pyrobaculum sp.]
MKEAACRREPRRGDGVYLSVNPMGGDCYLFFVSVGGRWGYVVEHAKRINDVGAG